jgi:hypothetical protein
VSMVGRDDVSHAADSMNDLGRGAYTRDHLVDRHRRGRVVGSRPVHDQRAVTDVANRGPKPETVAWTPAYDVHLNLKLARRLLIEIRQ